jgi:hypothetical protein
LQQTKQNKIESKKQLTLQEKRIVPLDEEGVPRGHPQALTLVPLGYFLGCMGIPKLELLSILQLISSFSNPYT